MPMRWLVAEAQVKGPKAGTPWFSLKTPWVQAAPALRSLHARVLECRQARLGIVWLTRPCGLAPRPGHLQPIIANFVLAIHRPTRRLVRGT